MRAILDTDRLRKYPDPSGLAFRKAAAKVLDVDPDAILIGNGSDDILTIVTRAFVPEGGLIASPMPSYVLYKSLAEIQGARFESFPYAAGCEPDVRRQSEFAVGDRRLESRA
jgi:histidinol-phosphate aminotransferase